MDLLLILIAFLLGFALFISAAYFLAKLIFPKLVDEDLDFDTFTKRDSHMPRITRKNPYSFE